MAIVTATVLGRTVEIDFLLDVVGVPTDQITRRRVQVDFLVRSGTDAGMVPLSVMHPLHLLRSRAGNVIALGRRDGTSGQQLDVAPLVLKAFLSEMLGEGVPAEMGRARDVSLILKALAEYMTTDTVGRQIHRYGANNPIEVFRAFRNDPRLDERYRDHQIQQAIDDIAAKQAHAMNRAAMMAARSRGIA